MNRRNGNTLVYTLLGLVVATTVALCFAPLQLRPCGHRCSLADRGFSGWKPHDCAASGMLLELYNFEGYLESAAPQYLSTNEMTGIGGYKFIATLKGDHWQITVDNAGVLPGCYLPGWYLLTTDGWVHFSEKGPATAKDPVLDNLPAP